MYTDLEMRNNNRLSNELNVANKMMMMMMMTMRMMMMTKMMTQALYTDLTCHSSSVKPLALCTNEFIGLFCSTTSNETPKGTMWGGKHLAQRFHGFGPQSPVLTCVSSTRAVEEHGGIFVSLLIACPWVAHMGSFLVTSHVKTEKNDA